MQDPGLSELAQFLNEFWELNKKYYKPKESEWGLLISEANSLAGKYNNDYFTQLLLVMVNDIDRRAGCHKGDGFEALYKRLRGKRDGMEQVR